MYRSALFCFVLALALVPLMANPQSSRQSGSTVTSTTTTTTTTTSTSTISTSTICASYINASTTCRRRRDGDWLDTPILLSLDDDEIFDFFSPSGIHGMQATPLVHFLPRSTDVESSHGPAEEQPGEADDSFRVAEPIYFSQLAAIFPVLSGVFGISSTTFVTATETSTVVSTTTTTTSTKPIILSGCIPPGFTYNTCS